MSIGSKRYCPNCEKETGQVVKGQYYHQEKGMLILRIIWHCWECGEENYTIGGKDERD